MSEPLGTITAVCVVLTLLFASAFVAQFMAYMYLKSCEMLRDIARVKEMRVTLKNAEWNTGIPPEGALIIAHAGVHASVKKFPIVGRVHDGEIRYNGGDFPIDTALLSWIEIPESFPKKN